MALLSITLIFFFFFFTSFITFALSASNNTCPPPTICGDINIHYPFWLINSSNTTNTTTTNSSSYCGYPGFGLTCNDKHPLLHLPNVDYYIVLLNYATYTVTLVDIEVYDQKCPQPRNNLTFDHSLNFFRYTPNDLNFTFFFNCSAQFNNSVFQPTPLSCLPNSYVVKEDLFLKDTNWYSYCAEAVMLPVLSDFYVNMSVLGKQFGEALNDGFKLSWDPTRDCKACEDSGGSCLHEKKQGSFSGCLCDDVLHAYRCAGMILLSSRLGCHIQLFF
ncbi:hypothetical protein QJS04_geneDACA018523 [Acorus gramineus]|uniref:Uncharacterized protein n=1 Tax=Acorus gramineus TaxID=55184 RepID=A0AAV9B0F7_ACOGR|nr:hypothetical protein QJS04_geneDACA018523 [Acorus gramineus]